MRANTIEAAADVAGGRGKTQGNVANETLPGTAMVVDGASHPRDLRELFCAAQRIRLLMPPP
jgi:hypothetical protein